MVNNNNSMNGAGFCRVACAVIFLVFSFCYLYFYQSNVMTAVQFIASGGRTNYSPLVGALLITIILYLLQVSIQAIIRLKRLFYGLTYFPSFLILALITDIPSDVTNELSLGAWEWMLPVILIVWAALVFIAKQYQQVEVSARTSGILSQVTGINFTLLLLMMFMVGFIGNDDRLFHQRMKAEALIVRGNYAEAVNVVDSSKSADRNLRFLRTYALAKQHRIGDRLFKYDMLGQSTVVPYSYHLNTVIIHKRTIIGCYKRDIDWQLSEMLIRKDLSAFVATFRETYGFKTDSASSAIKDKEVRDSILQAQLAKIPLHYREALVLYYELNPGQRQPLIDKNLISNYEKFVSAKSLKRREPFKQTYWFYYLYKLNS